AAELSLVELGVVLARAAARRRRIRDVVEVREEDRAADLRAVGAVRRERRRVVGAGRLSVVVERADDLSRRAVGVLRGDAAARARAVGRGGVREALGRAPAARARALRVADAN